jgi:hypothetical protein
LPGAHDLEPHAALEVARGDAHEGDAVAVCRVHVGLDLEDDAAELRLVGLTSRCIACAGRRGRQVDQRVQHLAHAEVVDRRAEEHGRLVPVEELLLVEGRRGHLHQLDVVPGVLVFGAEALGVDRVVEGPG